MPRPDHQVADEQPRPSPDSGARPGPLMIIGGAEDKLHRRGILTDFVGASGGADARIVVIPAASSLGDEVIEVYEPSPLSPYSTPEHADPAFALIEETISEVFPDAVPAPYVMMAATDSRHFTAISDHVYRFAPFRMTKAQREAIHSYDEHIGVSDLVEGARWYRLLIERLPRD